MIFCSYRYDACILMFVWMFVLVPQYNFIIHDICMKTLNVYFHAVHFLNKPIMFLIKKKNSNSCVWHMEICLNDIHFGATTEFLKKQHIE